MILVHTLYKCLPRFSADFVTPWSLRAQSFSICCAARIMLLVFLKRFSMLNQSTKHLRYLSASEDNLPHSTTQPRFHSYLMSCYTRLTFSYILGIMENNDSMNMRECWKSSTTTHCITMIKYGVDEQLHQLVGLRYGRKLLKI